MINGNFKINPKRQEDNNDQAIDKLLLEKEYKKLERVKQAYEDGVDSLTEYKENKEKILAHIKILEKEEKPKQNLAQMKKIFIQKVMNDLISLKDETLPDSIKNIILRSFVSDIIFYRSNGALDIVYYM
jgi:hypothetical protein